jgi:hypothetical protein
MLEASIYPINGEKLQYNATTSAGMLYRQGDTPVKANERATT